MPMPEASISTQNGREKSCKLNTGALHRVCFRFMKACLASKFQWNESLASSVVRGAAIEE